MQADTELSHTDALMLQLGAVKRWCSDPQIDSGVAEARRVPFAARSL